MIGMDRVACDDNEDEDVEEEGIDDSPPRKRVEGPPRKLVEGRVIGGVNSSGNECDEGDNPCELNSLACLMSPEPAGDKATYYGYGDCGEGKRVSQDVPHLNTLFPAAVTSRALHFH